MLTTLSPILDITDIKCESYDFEKPKRKRQRLDHLSQEEKLMRRKLKNRMAAQTARDRKKVKMQDLEEDVIRLSKERNALLNRNESLRLKNLSLQQENKELKKRLCLINEKQSIKVQEVSERCEWSEPLESAELISDPLPKEQVKHPSNQSLKQTVQTLMMLFVYSFLVKNLMLFSMFFTCIQKNSLIQTSIRTKQMSRPSMKSNQSQCQAWKTCHHNWSQLKT